MNVVRKKVEIIKCNIPYSKEKEKVDLQDYIRKHTCNI